MSRTESQEYPSTLRARPEGQRERSGGYNFSAPFSHHDRRQLPTSTPSAPREYGYEIDNIPSGPNRSNSQKVQISPALGSFASFNPNGLHRPSTSPSNIISTHPAAPIYHSQSSIDLREHAPRHGQSTTRGSSPPSLLPSSNSSTSRSTLWWGDLEAWMDEPYAQQVCTLMGWDPVNVKVPHPAAESSNAQQPPNNPGYCFLTFPSQAHAAAVLAQINNAGKPVQMPNSSRPFVLNWASSVPTANSSSSPGIPVPLYASGAAQQQQQQFQKEYSIFVGDLAPETSNSDLVAVFRNPVLGLRNDREPKYIRPFSSCKSAKIMLDPITGVSRGYGFVRFTDEADQQRALIEMHGLYCLSRPMRISPATAKHKSQAPSLPPSLPFEIQSVAPMVPLPEQKGAPLTVALPLPSSTTSVSAPIAAAISNQSITSNGGTISSSSFGGSNSNTSISSNGGSSSSLTSAEDAQHALNQLAKHYANGELGVPDSLTLSLAQHAQLRQALQNQASDPAPRFVVHEEHWKHHAQARAILGNLIGPNGEQLTSTDPYNTTVFVGGLSPLIAEDTLRTFFAPFGDIHYVKVPVGKHCGFVQFVRKADAERAIEKMQGFPIGGSKIRLSWGRSQYKAAQAAAQAAQAALQTPYATQPGTLTQDQALALLQKFALQNYRPDQLAGIPHLSEPGETDPPAIFPIGHRPSELLKASDEPVRYDQYASYLPRPEVHRTLSNFSPFSPDLATVSNNQVRNTSYLDIFSDNQELKSGGFTSGVSGNARVSPPGSRPSSTSRYGWWDIPSDASASLASNVAAPIVRPSSGSGTVDSDPVHDINNTLASLELDRPSTHSSQFHLAANTSS